MRCLVLLFPFLLNAQFVDNFTYGNFSSKWHGEISKFKINDQKELQLYDTTKSKKAYLVTKIAIPYEVFWEFSYKYNSNPSSSNYTLVYLISDSENLKNPLNGYFVKLGGESGNNDKISIYKQMGKTKKNIFSSNVGQILNAKNQISLKLKITKNTQNQWQIFCDKENKNSLILIGNFTENLNINNGFFGLMVAFTSSKYKNFYFDNFKIKEIDNSPPIILNTTIENINKIKLVFSKELHKNSLQLQNFQLNGNENPIHILYENKTIVLTFKNHLQENKNYNVTIKKLTDLSSNIVQNTISKNVSFQTTQPQIITHEILSSTQIKITFNTPLNQTLSKSKTYFELSQKNILKWNWNKNGTQVILNISKILPNKLYLLKIKNLKAIQYKNFPVKVIENTTIPIQVVLTKPYIKNIKVLTKNKISVKFSEKMDFISATNIKNYHLEDITIINATYMDNQTILHTENIMGNQIYNLKIKPIQSFAKNNFNFFLTEVITSKISILIKKTKLLKTTIKNATCISFDFNNRVNATTKNITVQNATTQTIQFKNDMKTITINIKENLKPNFEYKVNLIVNPLPYKGIIISKLDTVFKIIKHIEHFKVIQVTPVNETEIRVIFNQMVDLKTANRISNYSIDGVNPYEVSVKDKIVILSFYNEFLNDNYTLKLKNIKPYNNIQGFYQNSIITKDILFSTYKPQKRELLLNEILPNPYENGSEFIEIYNFTEKYINLENYYLSNFTDEDEILFKNKKKLPYILIKPKSYLVFTKNKEGVTKFYKSVNTNDIIEISSLPYLPNESGKIALLTNENILLDKVYYQDNMYFKNYTDDDKKGTSLERVNFNTNHWQSSTKKYNGASPTLKNTVATTFKNTNDNEISFTNKVFTPNQDGIDDMLQINYNFKTNQNSVTIKILNHNGNLKHTLIKDELTANKGSWFWNGANQDGVKLPMGFYIIVIEVVTIHNQTPKIYKQICVLGY